MTWNWQRTAWPKFRWENAPLRRAEERFLLQSGEFAGIVQHLSATDREHMTVDAISTEALTTSTIEGETLDGASVQSSIRRQFGMATDRRRVKPAEQGVAEMMVNLFRTFGEPLSDETLSGWHRMLLPGRRDLRHVGHYRTDPEPMQVVSGALTAPRLNFEAPPSSRVPEEMEQFLKWFAATGPTGSEPLPALTRAGIAHLYFESIHPFEDGNGRIGRAIAEKALAQTLGRPTLTALAATILVRRKEYYAALEAANREMEITAWLRWFAGVAIEAQLRTAAGVGFLLDKARLLDRMRGQLPERQERALLRMLREGPEGFRGGLSAANYATITGTPPATVTRDLAELVTKGALERTGERRYTRYFLTIPSRTVPAVEICPDGEILELE